MRYAAPINSVQYWSIALTDLFAAVMVNGTDRPICRSIGQWNSPAYLATKQMSFAYQVDLKRPRCLEYQQHSSMTIIPYGRLLSTNGNTYLYLYEQVNIHSSLIPSNKRGKVFSHGIYFINGTTHFANIRETHSVMENE